MLFIAYVSSFQHYYFSHSSKKNSNFSCIFRKRGYYLKQWLTVSNFFLWPTLKKMTSLWEILVKHLSFHDLHPHPFPICNRCPVILSYSSLVGRKKLLWEWWLEQMVWCLQCLWGFWAWLWSITETLAWKLIQTWGWKPMVVGSTTVEDGSRIQWWTKIMVRELLHWLLNQSLHKGALTKGYYLSNWKGALTKKYYEY